MKNNFFKTIVSCIFLLTIFFSAKGQVFYSENFNTGASNWVTTPISVPFPSGTNAASFNEFFINTGGGNTIDGTNCLHVSCDDFICGFLGGPDDAIYNEGNATDRISFSQPITTPATGVITLKFKWLSLPTNASMGDFGAVYFRTSPVNPWVLISEIGGQTTVQNFSQNISGANGISTLQIGFRWQNNANGVGQDPALVVDDITLETPVASATITTGVLPNTTVCAGATFNVPFTSNGTFNAGNQFTAELSDASGSFAAPVVIGNSAASPVPVTIPIGTPTGSGYLIRIVSSNPVLTGSSSVTTLTVNASQALTVALTADATSVCPGATVNFTATPGQTLTNATYAWSVGGLPQAGQTTSTLSAPIITNPTIVQVTLTTTDACFNPATATANVTISTAGQPLTVSITASDDTICSGQNVTFTALTSPAVLTNATYTWLVNNIQQQTGASPTFSTISLTGLNAIKVVVSSTDVCLSDPSDEDEVQVLQQSTPLAVTITVSPNNNPCPGAPLEFTANVTPANASGLTYQWKINGNDVAGQVLSTFNTTTYADGDAVTVVVTTNDPCVDGTTETSNPILITYSSGPEASVTAVASQLEVCSGTPVTFTATPVNGGVSPVYTWLVNGVATGGSGPVFASAGLVGGATVQVVMQSSETCVTNNPDTADVTITVIQKVQPTAVLNETIRLCANSSGRIVATVTPLGGTFNWTVNGSLVSLSGGSFFTNQDNVGDIIGLTYESIPGCVFVDSIASNFITVQLNDPPEVNLGADLEITFGDEIQLNASVVPANSIFTWIAGDYLACSTPGTNCIKPFASPTDSLNVLVLVAANPTSGCTSSDTLIIRVKTNYDIFIPTAFSPNGDGNNDVLYVRNPPKQFKDERFLFRIFNEYGEKVFESEFKEFGWDGKHRDKFALPGVYIYHLTGIYADGKPFDQKGKFLLMK
jgi:gliding motility-associated-like protein